MRPWTHTNPREGNKWRKIAKGNSVYAFPIWLYCDDTSGNKTKKWNKHNSYLFIPAGLLHHLVHCEYNLHFIATSNLAEPLEMLEGIVDQIEYDAKEIFCFILCSLIELFRYCQKNGIWAWDCLQEEVVVLIPSVLALLGDNPMQSEFASHIGMNGKLFCRVCLASNPTVAEEHMDADGAGDDECPSCADESSQDSDSGPNKSNRQIEENAAERTGARNKARMQPATGKGKDKMAQKKKQGTGKGRGKKPETLNQLVERTREFLMVNILTLQIILTH